MTTESTPVSRRARALTDELQMPETCSTQTYCIEKHNKYPQEDIDKLLEKVPIFIHFLTTSYIYILFAYLIFNPVEGSIHSSAKPAWVNPGNQSCFQVASGTGALECAALLFAIEIVPRLHHESLESLYTSLQLCIFSLVPPESHSTIFLLFQFNVSLGDPHEINVARDGFELAEQNDCKKNYTVSSTFK